jgi:hypothetical protein
MYLRDLARSHRETDERDLWQLELLEQLVEIGGEGVVVVADAGLARTAEAAAVVVITRCRRRAAQRSAFSHDAPLRGQP